MSFVQNTDSYSARQTVYPFFTASSLVIDLIVCVHRFSPEQSFLKWYFLAFGLSQIYTEVAVGDRKLKQTKAAAAINTFFIRFVYAKVVRCRVHDKLNCRMPVFTFRIH